MYFCKVKRYYRHIALWICLPSLLLSTAGFSFHTLYCLCKGETQVSLLFIPDPCTQAALKAPVACCTKNSTCSKPGQTVHSDEAEHPHDCSRRGFLFAKLNTPFLFASGDHELKPIFPALALPPFCLITPGFPALKQGSFLLPNQHAPPPPSGMDLRRFLKSYRC